LDDYLCLTLISRSGETEAGFKARLSDFWTHLLRRHEALFAQVYAEMTAFEKRDDRLARKYLVEATAAPAMSEQLQAKQMDFEPIDEDDVYSKFEAVPPDWFWIEH
jgi:hypothetical protein